MARWSRVPHSPRRPSRWSHENRVRWLGGFYEWRICMPDKDGYPTPDEEATIQHWPPFHDYPGLLAQVKACWWQADWGWHEVPYVDPGTGSGAESDDTGIEYRLSTGGWSGNESLISLLRTRPVGFWSQCWIQSRRGGHYIFRVQTPVTR